METHINFLGKEYIKKELYINVKKYIEKHTALVTTIISGIITSTALFLNLLYIAHKIGELAYFNVNISYAFDQDKNSILLKMLLCLSVASIFLLTNFLGYLSYIRRVFFRYFIILSSLIIVLFYILTIATVGIQETLKDFFNVFPMILFFSIFISFSLNSFSIIYMFRPSVNDKIQRLKLEEKRITSKNKFAMKRKNKINNKIKLLTQKQQKKLTNIQVNNEENLGENRSIINLLITPILILCYFSIIIIISLGFGYLQSSDKTSFDTVSVNALTNLQEITFIEYDFNDYIVLFENSEYMIISPYVTEQNEKENNEAIVFTSLQIKIDNNNIPKINKSIKNITVNSNADDLENYKV